VLVGGVIMLPAPTLTLTIPSIHDDTVLDCRIYAPTKFLSNLRSQTTRWRKKAAIVAHPYAPLGGCYDDPIVSIVAVELLKDGFFVGTFNFRYFLPQCFSLVVISPELTIGICRGAGGSKGRTSWTAKPETYDCASFVGLMVYFMHYLSLPQSFYSDSQPSWDEEPYTLTPIPSHALLPQDWPVSPRSHKFAPVSPINTSRTVDGQRKNGEDPKLSPPLLLLAGYSYGSMITVQLPALSSILSLFSAPELGTAASEIRLRAKQLAKQQNDAFKSMMAALQEKSGNSANTSMSKHRRGRSLQPDETLSCRKTSACSSVRMGGEETDPDARRPSHDSPNRRSFSFESERLRRSVDRVRSLGRAPHDRSPVKSLPRQDSDLSKCAHSSNDSSSEDIDTMKESNSTNDRPAQNKMSPVALGDMKVSYLLISPLQGLVTKLATMWTFKSRHKTKDSSSKDQGISDCEAEDKLILNDTLAIFGDEDVFSSSKNLRSWACRLNGKDKSHFCYAEVVGAGHFWHEDGVVDEMRRNLTSFISRL
jgi:alpha/beta superfamily hydrolase